MKLLNIGCGENFHEDWVNIDFTPADPTVMAADLRKGLPFSNNSFDAIYHSHVLEHLTQAKAKYLLDECCRVLKPGGVLRVVVPDLESIIKNYTIALKAVELGIEEAEPDYDWIMLELYDQATRSFKGGDMIRFLRQDEIKNKDFIVSRTGLSGKKIIEQDLRSRRKEIWKKLKSQKISWFIQQSRNLLASILVAVIAGNEGRQAFQEGLFRRSGEVHLWMYDRFSLQRLLKEAGFTNVNACRPDESRIMNFRSYNLDTVENEVRKPGSLFMEGIKLY